MTNVIIGNWIWNKMLGWKNKHIRNLVRIGIPILFIQWKYNQNCKREIIYYIKTKHYNKRTHQFNYNNTKGLAVIKEHINFTNLHKIIVYSLKGLLSEKYLA